MLSNHLILCCPLLLLPSIFPRIRVFGNNSALRIRQPKYWSLGFSISPSNEYSGSISLRIDLFDLLAVHGTLNSVLQHHNSKASILQQFFLYGPTLTSIHDYWKNHSFDYMDLCQQNNVSALSPLNFQRYHLDIIFYCLPGNHYLIPRWLFLTVPSVSTFVPSTNNLHMVIMRIIVKDKLDHVTFLEETLQWPHISFRIKFKLTAFI